MVCRLYKALAAFAVTGCATSLGAVFLDLRVRKGMKERGMYNQMTDFKAPVEGTRRESEPAHDKREDEWETLSRGASHDGTRPYRMQRPIEARQFGYEAPSEQTSYSGGGSRM